MICAIGSMTWLAQLVAGQERIAVLEADAWYDVAADVLVMRAEEVGLIGVGDRRLPGGTRVGECCSTRSG